MSNTTIATVTINNKALNAQLTTIKNEMVKAEKSLWRIAKAYATIVDGELFKDDFGTLENLGQYVGCSKSTISRMVNAYKAKNNFALTDDYTTSQVIELLPCKDNIVECIETMGITPNDSQKDIRTKVKNYLHPQTEEDTKDEIVEVVESEEVEELNIIYKGQKIELTGSDYIKVTDILNQYIEV